VIDRGQKSPRIVEFPDSEACWRSVMVAFQACEEPVFGPSTQASQNGVPPLLCKQLAMEPSVVFFMAFAASAAAPAVPSLLCPADLNTLLGKPGVRVIGSGIPRRAPTSTSPVPSPPRTAAGAAMRPIAASCPHCRR
jgi:hypothetical protein